MVGDALDPWSQVFHTLQVSFRSQLLHDALAEMPNIELLLDLQIIFLCISTHSLNNQCFIHRNERNDYYTVDPTKAHVMEMKVTSKQYKIKFCILKLMKVVIL